MYWLRLIIFVIASTNETQLKQTPTYDSGFSYCWKKNKDKSQFNV